jgi:hypothetical protein
VEDGGEANYTTLERARSPVVIYWKNTVPRMLELRALLYTLLEWV